MSEDDEIIQEFLVESGENLDQLDQDLIALEQAPGSKELLSSIFRTIHTIKGTSGFLALSRLEGLTHVGENLLSRLRNGELELTPVRTEALLQMVDAVRALLDVLARTGSDVDDGVDVSVVTGRLQACLEDDTAQPAVETPAAAEPAPVAEAPAVEAPAPSVAVPAPAVTPAPAVEARVPGAQPVSTSEGVGTDVATAEVRKPSVDTTVRVDVELLDTLVRLVGELVLTRNQILQQTDVNGNPDLVRASQRLDLIASELQENVMRTRMQPIGQVWSKLPRMVRDLSAQLGRSVRLVMEGPETELDRTLLEAVKDPLTHLVRNALDHGIETPEARVQAGKSPEGVLTLRAFHESGQVVVEISDDGKGIDPAVIAAVAVKRGVVSADVLDRMDQREVLDLIFRPGFSTAAAVTNVSGRGVGMDVVRTNIERIGGSVDLSSRPGLGTTFRVRIPLTLAIIPALVVGEQDERYAIPQANLVELVRLEGKDISSQIKTLAGAPVLQLRGHLVPLVSLGGALGLAETESDIVTIVVVQADDLRFGLRVADVCDTQEIVVKPLGRQLKGIRIYAGATIMGDGRVALILDIAGLAHAAGITANSVQKTVETSADDDKVAMLVLEVGNGRRAALPLAEISRLEEFEPERVEWSGRTEVAQYRGGILPLIRLAEAIGLNTSTTATDQLSIVVHGEGPDRVGIVVDRVIDVVDTARSHTAVGARPGVLGSAVVRDRVTDLVDVDHVVAAALAGHR